MRDWTWPLVPSEDFRIMLLSFYMQGGWFKSHDEIKNIVALQKSRIPATQVILGKNVLFLLNIYFIKTKNTLWIKVISKNLGQIIWERFVRYTNIHNYTHTCRSNKTEINQWDRFCFLFHESPNLKTIYATKCLYVWQQGQGFVLHIKWKIILK